MDTMNRYMKMKSKEISYGEIVSLFGEYRTEMEEKDRIGIFRVIEDSYSYRNGEPGTKVSILKIVMDYYCILTVYCHSKGFEKGSRKTDTLFEIGSCFLKMVVSTDMGVKRTVDELSEVILKFSVNNPPQSYEVFSLEEMKDLFDMFARQVLCYFDMYVSVLRSKKQMGLRLFELFKKSMPTNLSVDHARVVGDPLDIIELRKFILKPGEIYFSEKEMRDILEQDRLGSLSPAEQDYIMNSKDRIERNEKITKVLEKKLGELKLEGSAKMQEVKDLITSELK